MSKFNLSKQKILILAISAVVVIAGAVASVVLIRNFTKKEDNTTTATVPQYVEETYFVTVPEYVTNENNETVTDNSGNALTTIKKVVKTTKKAVAAAKTTKKTATPAGTTKKAGTTKHMTPIMSYLEKEQIAGYRYDAQGDFYYTDDKDCWQKSCGYNEIYDNLAPAAAMNIDQIRVRFQYGGKEWMLQLWKGQYGFVFVGAETGVYTAPLGSFTGNIDDINHYDCAAEEDWLYMQLDCYWSEKNNGHYKKIFTREYDKYWWATGFVKGHLTKYTWPRTEIKAKNRITFKSKEMADVFVLELRRIGFKRAVAANQLVDDSYFQNGKDVYLLWTSIYHDAFTNLQSSLKATTKATTTKKPTTTKAPATTAAPVTTAAPTTAAPTTTKAPTTTAPTTTAAPSTTEVTSTTVAETPAENAGNSES